MPGFDPEASAPVGRPAAGRRPEPPTSDGPADRSVDRPAEPPTLDGPADQSVDRRTELLASGGPADRSVDHRTEPLASGGPADQSVDRPAEPPAEDSSADADPGIDQAGAEATGWSALLPDITTDERDLGWGELPEPTDDDRYLREIPPHHGS